MNKLIKQELSRISDITDFNKDFLTFVKNETELIQLSEFMEMVEYPELIKKHISYYVFLFCDKHDLRITGWVTYADVITLNDYTINFSDIKLDIDFNQNKNDFWEWYDYNIERGKVVVNYLRWIRGINEYFKNEL